MSMIVGPFVFPYQLPSGACQPEVAGCVRLNSSTSRLGVASNTWAMIPPNQTFLQTESMSSSSTGALCPSLAMLLPLDENCTWNTAGVSSSPLTALPLHRAFTLRPSDNFSWKVSKASGFSTWSDLATSFAYLKRAE